MWSLTANAGSDVVRVESKTPIASSPWHWAGTLGQCALLVVLASCAGQYIEPNGGGVMVKNRQVGWYTKKVITKRAPDSLVAEDATICRVSADRYAATRTGAAVYCNWQ